MQTTGASRAVRFGPFKPDLESAMVTTAEGRRRVVKDGMTSSCESPNAGPRAVTSNVVISTNAAPQVFNKLGREICAFSSDSSPSYASLRFFRAAFASVVAAVEHL
jgi:hypothetical protein